MKNYTFEDFQNALNNSKMSYYPSDNYEMMGYGREDIYRLSDCFKENFGFRLLDIEIFLIWKWHSSEFDAIFLCTNSDPYKDMRYFKEFVDRFSNK